MFPARVRRPFFHDSRNFKRHLREKSGARLFICEDCVTTFTRKSNRDQHVFKGTCKSVKPQGTLSQTNTSGNTNGADGFWKESERGTLANVTPSDLTALPRQELETKSCTSLMVSHVNI